MCHFPIGKADVSCVNCHLLNSNVHIKLEKEVIKSAHWNDEIFNLVHVQVCCLYCIRKKTNSCMGLVYILAYNCMDRFKHY